jgi:hypothetical protein
MEENADANSVTPETPDPLTAAAGLRCDGSHRRRQLSRPPPPELLTFCGRTFTTGELELVRQITVEFSALPGVRIQGLTGKILGLSARQMPPEWEERYRSSRLLPASSWTGKRLQRTYDIYK